MALHLNDLSREFSFLAAILWSQNCIFHQYGFKLFDYIFDSVGWTPSFLLKRYVLSGIRDGPHEPFIADSVDFVVAQVKVVYEPVFTNYSFFPA